MKTRIAKRGRFTMRTQEDIGGQTCSVTIYDTETSIRICKAIINRDDPTKVRCELISSMLSLDEARAVLKAVRLLTIEIVRVQRQMSRHRS